MTFSQTLQEYVRMLDCTAAELSEASGLSKSMISRYLSGERVPANQGRSLHALSAGISQLSQRGGETGVEEESVYRRLSQTLTGIDIDYDIFIDNLTRLMDALELGNSELARALNFDPSYISRILSRRRRPGDLPRFLMDISRFIARRCADGEDRSRIAALTGCTLEEAAQPEECARAVSLYLGSAQQQHRDPVEGFLSSLDSFDLDEYIRAVHFDQMKVPSSPFQLPRSKSYIGLEEIRESELDFLRLTVHSRSREDVFFYSEMPLEQISKDKEFIRKWMYGVAMLLKKGLRLQVIHDVSRPFGEMMMGLEAWIPLYMTGQISPHYFKGRRSDIFLHHLKVSGAGALYGEAVAGHYAQGRYYLTNNREELQYYRSEADMLLKKALPLMQIYTVQQRRRFQQHRAQWARQGSRRMICSAIPLFCVQEDTLQALLERHQLPTDAAGEILDYASSAREEMTDLLSQSRVELELPLLEREEYDEHPMGLCLSELFSPYDVVCTYEEYQTLLREAEAFAAQHPSLILRPDTAAAFRNVNITVVENDLAVVSKSKSPTIHFVIRHPRMVEAMAHFVPPVGEEEE